MSIEKNVTYKRGTAYDKIFQNLIVNSQNNIVYCNHRHIARALQLKLSTVKVCIFKLTRRGYIRVRKKIKNPIEYIGYDLLKYPINLLNLRAMDMAFAFYVSTESFRATQYKRIAKYFQLPSADIKDIIIKLESKGLLNLEWDRLIVLEPLKSEVLHPINRKSILNYISRCTTQRERTINGRYHQG